MSWDTSLPGEGETADSKAGATTKRKPPSIFHGCVQLSVELARDDNFAVFRTFDDLNMLNLLTLQAELAELRSELFGSILGMSGRKLVRVSLNPEKISRIFRDYTIRIVGRDPIL
jgi:hypothetical protein